MERIGVIGSGTWGTAIAILLSHNGHEVTLWSAIPSEIEELEKHAGIRIFRRQRSRRRSG